MTRGGPGATVTKSRPCFPSPPGWRAGRVARGRGRSHLAIRAASRPVPLRGCHLVASAGGAACGRAPHSLQNILCTKDKTKQKPLSHGRQT